MITRRCSCGSPISRLATQCGPCHLAQVRQAMERECAGCHRVFVPKKSDRGTYCSRACSFTAASVRRTVRVVVQAQKRTSSAINRAWRQALKEDARRSPRKVAVYGPIPCRECQLVFVPIAGAQRWCSRICRVIGTRRQDWTAEGRRRKADRRARRKALKRGAYVARVYRRTTFERDGWICQLCGGAVDRAATVPSPLAATIDHVVPLAKGGTHEPGNVQCAHFICNSIKSDRTSYRLSA